MKQRNRARSSSLFLLELIIAILFFSACASVCVLFFVKSHTMSQNSEKLNFAVNECTTLAEIIQSSDTETAAVSAIKEIYPDSYTHMNPQDTTMDIYFDRNFSECNRNDVIYIVKANIATNEGMIIGNVYAGTEDESANIYELEVKHNEKIQ